MCYSIYAKSKMCVCMYVCLHEQRNNESRFPSIDVYYTCNESIVIQ